jgi:GNAT superfamily N-acetyltransferase
MIRLATADDEDAILGMAREFAAFTPYKDLVVATDDELRTVIRWFVDNATIFISDDAGKAVGMLFAILSPVWYAPRFKMATEIAWWVAPSHRGGSRAVRLVREFESWARSNGAVIVNMSNLQMGNASQVAGVLKKLGYSLSEQTHSKRI